MVFGAVVLAMSFASLLVYRPADASLAWQAIFDWMHVPVFAVIGATLAWLSPAKWSPIVRFAAVISVAILLAVSSEIIQIPLGRSASLADVLSDLQGSIAGVMAVAAWQSKGWRRLISVIVALAVIVWSVSSPAQTMSILSARAAKFPIIFDGNDHSFLYVTAQDSQLTGNNEFGGLIPVTRVEFARGAWPGIEIHDLASDWRDHSQLKVSLQVEGTETLEFTIRVHDLKHRKSAREYNDRFNRLYTLPPGDHIINIDLEDIRTAPRGRDMNMAEIDAINIFSSEKYIGRAIRIYRIWLD
jgi:VanZ family protein